MKLFNLLDAAFIRLGFFIPDTIYLRVRYYFKFKKRLNLKHPITFNEKLQWLKLHDRKREYTIMADKVKSKNWAANIIGEEYILPNLNEWEKPEDIDFDSLPDKFVLKTNHDSGGLIICQNKNELDQSNAIRFLKRSLKRNFYKAGREWPYKDIPRRILAEPFISTISNELTDYKFMCFNGVFKYCFTCTDRNNNNGLKVTFFDREWNKLPFTRHYPSSDEVILKPKNFEKMIDLAEKLSRGTKFLRVDFYEADDRIIFGELTFFPGCGFEEFSPGIWDTKLGELIQLH